MHSQVSLITDRLLLEPLAAADHRFIFELLNTEGWKRFIGNRQVDSAIEAQKYVERIRNNPNTLYWVIKLKETKTPLGIVTLIKREYLQHHDIGFALLPFYNGKGYAFEAARKVMEHVSNSFNLSYVQATTVPENSSSVKLLVKLGFGFQEEIEVQDEILHVYGAKLSP